MIRTEIIENKEFSALKSLYDKIDHYLANPSSETKFSDRETLLMQYFKLRYDVFAPTYGNKEFYVRTDVSHRNPSSIFPIAIGSEGEVIGGFTIVPIASGMKSHAEEDIKDLNIKNYFNTENLRVGEFGGMAIKEVYRNSGVSGIVRDAAFNYLDKNDLYDITISYLLGKNRFMAPTHISKTDTLAVILNDKDYKTEFGHETKVIFYFNKNKTELMQNIIDKGLALSVSDYVKTI